MSTPVPSRTGSSLAAVLILYTLARAGLVTAIAGMLLLAGVPLVIAVLVGLVVALPLSMVLFPQLRARLDEAVAVASVRRGAERAALRARLRGDTERPEADRPENDLPHAAHPDPDPVGPTRPPPTSDEPAQGEPDSGRG